MTILLSLWTIALGYFVFAHATALKGEVKTVGRIAGMVMMLIALAGVLCGTACKVKTMGCDKGMTQKCDMKAKGVCPITKH